MSSGGGRSGLAAALVAALVTAACAVEDRSGPEEALRLTPDASTVRVGETVLFSARGARGPVTWTTSDPLVAVVANNSGQAKAVGPGTARVIARSGGRTGEAALVVVEPPRIALSATSFAFTAAAGGADPAPRAVAITAGGEGVLEGLGVSTTYAQGQPAGWLSATLSRTSAPATLALQPNTAGLVAGTYVAMVQVTAAGADNSPQVVTVAFEVADGPAVAFSPDSARLEARYADGPATPLTVDVVNGGGGGAAALRALSASVPDSAQGWLRAHLNSTVSPAELTLIADPDTLSPGRYATYVTVASANGTAGELPVVLDVVEATGAVIVLSSTSARFVAEPDAADPADAVIDVTNGGVGTLTGLFTDVAYGVAQPTGWLTATLGAETAPTTLTLQPAAGGLAEGTYTATVFVKSSVSGVASRTVGVELVVAAAPIIDLSETSIDFGATEGGSDPSPRGVSVTNGGSGTLTGLSVESITYDAGGATDWLSATLAASDAPTTLTLQPTTGSLPAGTYSATVTVGSSLADVASETVDVILTVDPPPPVIGLSQPSASFPAEQAPFNQAVIGIVNDGGGTLSGLEARVEYVSGSGWLTHALDPTTAPATLTLTVSAEFLGSAGTYQANVIVYSETLPEVVPDTVHVQYVINTVFAEDVQQAVFDVQCTSCHMGPFASDGLDLSPGVSYGNLINVNGEGDDGVRVKPFDPDGSLIICKVDNTCAHGRGSAFPVDIVETLRRWIREGAPNTDN